MLPLTNSNLNLAADRCDDWIWVAMDGDFSSIGSESSAYLGELKPNYLHGHNDGINLPGIQSQININRGRCRQEISVPK